jgi:cell wall-associated NlpC family hydrolase
MRFKHLFPIVFVSSILAGCATAPSERAPGPPAPTDAAAPASEVAFAALALVGSRYAAGGASPATGFDCSGLVAYVYQRALALDLPRDTLGLARAGQPVRDPRPGDLLFYNTQGRAFSHVGIYLGESRFVHAPSSGGAVRIEDMRLAYWARRFDGARRVVE